MKRFLKFIPAFALLIAAVGTLSFKNAVSKSATVVSCTFAFEFTGSPGQENDPTQYLDISGSSLAFCNGTVKLCALCFSDASLVYTQAERDADPAHIPQSWVDQPKVNKPILTAAIFAALHQTPTAVNPFHYTDPSTGIQVDIFLKP